MQIGFNKPYFTGRETHYIDQAVRNKKLSGNGEFTVKCQEFFERRYGFAKCFLTTSCTDALEMAAILLDIAPGDEVIIPSFTFVSTANAFVLRGAEIRFADSSAEHPNIDPQEIERLITSRTKAIVVVHYAGAACDMDAIMEIAEKYGIRVVEDAAQAIDSYYKDRALGSIGHLAAFSFHETKNISCGEGGMLVLNDSKFIERAEIIWEKGTNRTAFWRGEVDKYSWVDVGSSFLPSEVTAAILWAQLEQIEEIQKKRISLWNTYAKRLEALDKRGYRNPILPPHATQNGHMYYVLCENHDRQKYALKYLNDRGISAVFHYVTLHNSPYFKQQYDGDELVNASRFSDCLFRLPIFYDLGEAQQDYIVDTIFEMAKT